MKSTMQVYSQHAFRRNVEEEADALPIHAPEGRAFMLVTPSPLAHPSKKRYLYDLIYNKDKSIQPKIIVTHSRDKAKKFDNLRLAEAFATFLANTAIFQHEHEFWIVLEPPVYKDEITTKKPNFAVIAEGKW